MTFRMACLLGGLFALGTAGRLWYLETLPSAGCDEANWLTLALGVYRGEYAELEPTMRFVPPTFGYFIAGLFHVFGPSLWAGRLVSVVGSLLLTAAVAVASLWWRRPSLTLALAALLLLHPWSLVWSRLCFAPYAIALVLGILGPLCWLMALEVKGTWSSIAAQVAAGQLLVLGLHFSPLAAIPIVVCGLWTWFTPGAKRTPAPWIALVLMSLHAWPIVLESLGIVAHARTRGDVFTTHEATWEKVTRYALANLDVLSGEGVVREFTNVSFGDAALWLSRVAVILVLGAAVMSLILAPRGQEDSSKIPGNVATGNAERSERLARLSRFTLFYLALALGGVPFILGAGRSWSFPFIDSERYGFAVLAPTLLSLSVGACCVPLLRWGLGVFVCLFCLTPMARLGNAMLHGGGPELGFFNFDGGGWRIWRPAQGPVSLVDHLGEVLRRESQKEPVIFIPADAGGLHPMKFEIEAHHKDRVAIRTLVQSFTGKYHWPNLNPRTLLVFAVWHDSLFKPYQPRFHPDYFREAANIAEDRREFLRFVDQAQLIETVLQPDGSPLLEIWRGRFPNIPVPEEFVWPPKL